MTWALFHGSEVGFWAHADSHIAGVLQAVPDAKGTEIILESTANGVGVPSTRCGVTPRQEPVTSSSLGISRKSIAVLCRPTSSWMPKRPRMPDSMGYRQSRWCGGGRRSSSSSPALFMQEYPATAAEAFQNSGHNAYIPPSGRQGPQGDHEPSGPLVIGFDPAWKGDARHRWRGAAAGAMKVESRRGLDTMQSAGWAKQVIDLERPIRMFIDVGGVGAGVYDRLVEMGYGDIVRAVNFGSQPMEPAPLDLRQPSGGPVNRRAEMWMKSKQWLEDSPASRSPIAIACRPTPADPVQVRHPHAPAARGQGSIAPAACRAPTSGTRWH